MSFHHLAHLQEFAKHVKTGVKIRRGDSLGKVGKSGTQYAHLHYEVMRSKPDRWTQYVYGPTGPYTKEQLLGMYFDPSKWIDKGAKIPAPYTTMGGYEFLDPINASKTAFHPGVDINDGTGDQDLGNEVLSPCHGEIVYAGKLDGGWGNHIWIKEDEEQEHPVVDWNFARSVAGRMFLAVQEHGEAWYVASSGVRHYMGATPEEMLEFIQKVAIGITSADLNKIPKA